MAQGSLRRSDGVLVDGQLDRFGEVTIVRGRTYRGPGRTTACVVANLWMVLRPGAA